MLDNFIREAVVLVVGKSYESLSVLLNKNSYVNEFIIAKKLEITINQARNLLYRLSESGLVSSIRKKDKKKGWYTYFWKIEPLKTLEFFKSTLSKKRDSILNQIKHRTENHYYICERCNIELEESQAILQNFLCNECGDVFTMEDNTKLLKDLNRNLEKYSSEEKLIDEEILKIREKNDKIRERKDKKVAKEKAKEKEKQRAKRKAERDALKKANEKVQPKKKSKKKISLKKVSKKKLTSKKK